MVVAVAGGGALAATYSAALLKPFSPDLYDEVVVPSGRVRGLRVHIQGEANERFGRQFLGIPYGKAGRWEIPEPADLSGFVDATRFRASCMRPHSFHLDETVAEDCLHLNIYTPLQVTQELTLVSPVLVWFHGGSFTVGAGSDTHREQVRELVLTHRLVVVTINYRLGVFGFLGSRRLQAYRHEGGHAKLATTGNFGILDQQLALKWVQKNIRYFGGNPNRVSIVGWSAGAASVSVHLSMPSSRGLFSTAIMMSGGFTDWAAQSMDDAEWSYRHLLQATGCWAAAGCRDVGRPCPCLRELGAVQLMDAAAQADLGWFPTVDGTVLPRFPVDALERGEVHPGVPIIIGSTVEDTTVDIGSEATRQNLREYLATLLYNESKLEQGYRLYADEVRPKASGEQRGYSHSYWAARRATSDQGMACLSRRVARKWRNVTGARAFWYLWEQGSLPLWAPTGAFAAGARRLQDARAPSVGAGGAGDAGQPEVARRLQSGRPLTVGSCWPCPGPGHGADLPYLFEQPELNVEDSAGDLADIYQSFFSDFIETGDPNSWYGFTLSKHGKKAWPSADDGGMRFIVDHSWGQENLRGTFCDFWDSDTVPQ